MSKELIYKESALDILDDFQSDIENSVPNAYAMARQRMSGLYPMNPDWIPCSERLPKAEEKVWIQTERGKVCFAMYEDGTIPEFDSAWHWYDLPFDKWDEENDCGIIPEGWWEWTEFHPDIEFDCPVDEVVVAWMPLPEPWKGADDDL